MSDLIAQIRHAQVRAAEDLICADLAAKGLAVAPAADVTLSAEDAHLLAVRLRRLCAHLNYQLPNFAANDASLINIAGTVIGALLTNMTHSNTEK